MRWTFNEQTSSVNRDPFEAQFFAEAEDDAHRTDALVRETVQNAKDARQSGGPATVRFAIHELAERPAWVGPYLEGLLPHLRAERVGLDPGPDGPLRWLVYEDFGTHGLRGEVDRVEDPPADGSAGRQDFFWFWRNVGRSGKTGEDLGRWGLGKSVLPAASLINAMVGLTVRSDDPGRPLLLGQCLVPGHRVGGKDYEPQGFFHDGETTKGRRPVYLPAEEAEVIEAFERDWRTTRRGRAGLSVVVPFLRDEIVADDLLRSAALHWFVAILEGKLVVEIADPDGTVRRLDRSNLEAMAAALSWTGTKRDKRHRPPPVSLAEWAVARRAEGMPQQTELAGAGKSPSWGEELFSPGLLDRLRADFAARRRVALRVRLQLEMKENGPVDTHFDAFFEFDEGLKSGEDDFARDGMSISGIQTLGSGQRGLRGLLLVGDGQLSSLLGDVEGPAHKDWNTSNKRPEKRFKTWSRRVTFVRDALKHLAVLLETPPKGLDRDLLADLFGLDDVAKQPAGGKRPKRAKSGPTPLPPKIETGPPKWFRVSQNADGFAVRRDPAATVPAGAALRVRFAYEGGGGSPLDRHDPIDFDLLGGPTTLLVPPVTTDGATATATGANELLIVPDGGETFRVRVRGFDPLRDLIVRTLPAGGEESEPEGGDE